ncbi:MAG: hypothetical protein IIW74_00295, partial [Rikenellaceae bacterium]|nr:hypothetical protein [Rikenellaceae bacterium]
MAIYDNIKKIFSKDSNNLRGSKDLNDSTAAQKMLLAAKARERQAILEALKQHTAALTRKDVGQWRR